jgi:hypothetical protein
MSVGIISLVFMYFVSVFTTTFDSQQHKVTVTGNVAVETPKSAAVLDSILSSSSTVAAHHNRAAWRCSVVARSPQPTNRTTTITRALETKNEK